MKCPLKWRSLQQQALDTLEQSSFKIAPHWLQGLNTFSFGAALVIYIKQIQLRSCRLLCMDSRGRRQEEAIMVARNSSQTARTNRWVLTHLAGVCGRQDQRRHLLPEPCSAGPHRDAADIHREGDLPPHHP